MNRRHDVHGGAPPCADRTSVDRSPRNHRAPKVARRRRNPRAPKRSHAAVMLHHRRRDANPSPPSTPRPPSTTIDHRPTTVQHSSDHRQPSLTPPHPRPSTVRPRYHRPNTVNPRPNHPRQPSSTLVNPRRDGWPAARDGGTRRGPGTGRAIFRKELSKQVSK